MPKCTTKPKILNFLFPLLVLFFVPPLSRANESLSEVDCGYNSCFIDDYNVGGGSLFELGDETSPSVAAGFFTNSEALFLESAAFEDQNEKGGWYLKDITFFDARLMSFIGGSARPGMDANLSVQFHLKLIGSMGGGLMLYQIFPVSLSLEDAALEIQNGSVRGSGLIGSTVVIPVSLLANLDAANLYVSLTVGARFTSDLSNPGMAVQPKVRFLSDKGSFEARALFTTASDEREQKLSLLAAVNHVFSKGDQMGIMIGASQVSSPNEGKRRGAEVLFFYGRNL